MPNKVSKLTNRLQLPLPVLFINHVKTVYTQISRVLALIIGILFYDKLLSRVNVSYGSSLLVNIPICSDEKTMICKEKKYGSLKKVSVHYTTKRIDNKDFRKLTYCRQFNWQPKLADGGDF